MREHVFVAAVWAAGLATLLAPRGRIARGAGLLATLAAIPVLPVLRAILLPALAAVALLWAIPHRRRARGSGSRRRWPLGPVAVLVMATLSGILLWAIPVARLAPPSGSYEVGIRDWVVRDSARGEPFTEDPGDPRILSVRAWYPVAPGTARDLPRAEYLPEVRAVYRGMARSLGVPPLVVSGAMELRSHGRTGAPPAPGRFPLVLYSGGFRQGHHAHNTEVAEELASRGYVVVGVNHPYEQALTLSPDGRVLTLEDPTVAGSVRLLLDESDPPPPGWAAPRTVPRDSAAAMIRRRLEALPRHRASALLWVGDVRAVLDRIDAGAGEAGGFLGEVVDTDRMGILGMSFGGSTAGLFCASEPRCRAAVNLDGTQWGPWFGDDFSRPVLYMSPDPGGWNDAWYAGAGRDYHRVRIAGALHGDFTDGFQSTPLTRLAGVLGPIGGTRSREILRAYVTAFFDRYLKEEPAPLLEGPAPFPEVSHVRDPAGTNAVR